MLLPSIALFDSFDGDVDQGYTSYTIIDEYENTYFRIKIIQGIESNRVLFGVVLFNAQARSHEMQVVIDNQAYMIPKNTRGDYYAPAIQAKGDVEIQVVDEIGNIRYRKEIVLLSEDDFTSAHSNILTGQSQGIALTSLRRYTNISGLTLLAIIFGTITIISLGIIILMVILKRGIFHPDRQLNEVFQYRDFITSLEKEEQQRDVVEQNNIQKKEEEKEETKIINLYPYMREYDDEDDYEGQMDITKYLREKGYNTNYKQATVEEKNDIMLELMKMRDFHDITEEQYKKEVIKLWSK